MAIDLRKDKHYTFEEYLEIDDGVKYELNDGVLYMMSAPFDNHVSIGAELIGQLYNYLKGKSCLLKYDSNVRLWKNRNTSYIPDISVICDKSKMTDFGCVGAPDFIIEIVSPSNPYRDYLVKYKDYENAGVKEYWIIDPVNKKVLVNILKENEYQLTIHTFDGIIRVETLSDCQIDLRMFN